MLVLGTVPWLRLSFRLMKIREVPNYHVAKHLCISRSIFVLFSLNAFGKFHLHLQNEAGSYGLMERILEPVDIGIPSSWSPLFTGLYTSQVVSRILPSTVVGQDTKYHQISSNIYICDTFASSPWNEMAGVADNVILNGFLALWEFGSCWNGFQPFNWQSQVNKYEPKKGWN